MNAIQDFDGTSVVLMPAEGKKLRTARDATDAMSEAFAQSAQWLAIPVSRLDEDFFRLRTGVAGEIVQKFVQFRVRVVFFGDISQHIAASDSFRDFVREANRGRDFWFMPSLDDFRNRLGLGRPRVPDSSGDEEMQQ